MELARRTRWLSLSLPFALAAVAILARPAPPGLAAAGPLMPADCSTPPSGVAAPDTGRAAAWYRLDPRLDASGTLVGQDLTVGLGGTRWAAALPPESFASGPVGGRVLVGDDDGQRSRLRILDTARGCWTELGTHADVIRSGVLAADGIRVYEHRVDRATRRDLGVWRRGPGDLAATERLLPGLDADPAYGPTYATSMLLGEDGQLAVNACGETACRTRVVDAVTGAVRSVAPTGPVLGLAAERLVVLDACAGMPCPVQLVDLRTGARTSIGDTAGLAALAADGSGLVVATDADGLLVRDGTGRDARVRTSAGLAPIARTSTADSGYEAPPGRIAVGPDGRVTEPALVRLLDPAAVQLSAGEVIP